LGSFFIIPALLNILPSSWNNAIALWLPDSASRPILQLTHDSHCPGTSDERHLCIDPMRDGRPRSATSAEPLRAEPSEEGKYRVDSASVLSMGEDSSLDRFRCDLLIARGQVTDTRGLGREAEGQRSGHGVWERSAHSWSRAALFLVINVCASFLRAWMWVALVSSIAPIPGGSSVWKRK
jgi:hypothetical protein